MSTVTVLATVTHNVTHTVASATATSTLRASPQGGILEGGNPSVYSSSNSIILFIIQAGIIIIFCRLLHYPLSLLRQPRVIAEVVGGILLGPSVMGHVPGFTNDIFPSASIPNLTLVANIGLVLFLFLVGLEVDLRYFVSNWRVALSVGTLGMALPFGLGWAVAYGLYHQFHGEAGTTPIQFATYALFIGVAMAITAFPVLCRILTELKLLSTPVGVIVLSAGVSNDVVGWILLALCVALVNSGSGITALWILLTCVGYALLLTFAVRPAFLWLLRRTRALLDGPSQGIVCLTLMIAFTSAFFTGVIGVHPIFGAFMAGLICPHEGGFAIKVTEKVEDLVSAIFLPLYFALSGLSTNLGLLNDGITWGYVIAVIAVAFCAKFAGGTLAAKLNGMLWRESFTVGVLMSCKGLVELIVLNIGLQAKILSQRTFTIFVLMALVTTFATTPLTAWLYPPWYQQKVQAWKEGKIDWATGAFRSDSDAGSVMAEKMESQKVRSLLVYLRLDSMPTLLAFISLFGGKPTSLVERIHATHDAQKAMTPEQRSTPGSQLPARTIEVRGVRLLELTERSSTVMKVSEVEEHSIFDPVLNAFRVLSQLFNLAVSGETAVVPESSYADTLTSIARQEASNLLLLPWSETGSMSETSTISSDSVRNKLASDAYAAFVSQALDNASCNTAVFVNKGFSGSLMNRPTLQRQRSMSTYSLPSHREHERTAPNTDRSHHIFLPFFGGADGRVAIRLVLQLAENLEVTATIVHFANNNASELDGITRTTVTAGKSASSAAPAENDAAFFAAMQRSIPTELQSRVLFSTFSSLTPIKSAVSRAQEEMAQNPRNGGDLVVLGRNKGATTANSCLGDAAVAVVESGVRASVLVVQAATPG
ncbi:hypothetical protein EJ03DRAFT_325837 [Teratosphaeria nubilosa]|uniref:Cation/H+ exchanger transmembrane domain-containing protein n=1 Tax=Teratosphaeria nubilosa TaxID=161662 RepID=A0A6G1LF34_9PEZI|nr:hypothetical protein EJ03DRAFT_325837 [Teratosphaeria nubilosa]